MPAPNGYSPVGQGAEGAFGPYKYALKELYERYSPLNLTYQDNLFMAMLAKDEAFYGASLPLVQQFTNPQSTSGTFQVAKAFQNNSDIIRFAISRKRKYSFTGIEAETWMATKSDMGSFISASSNEYSSTITAHSQQINTELFLDGTGALSSIASQAAVSATVFQLTLVQPADSRRFERKMRVVFSNSGVYPIDLKSTANGSGGTLAQGSITAIDRSQGILTVTFDSVFSVTPTFTGVFIGIQGTMIQGALPNGVAGAACTGLKAWLPIVAPTSADLLYGIDRTQDTDRLSGVRIQYGGSSVLEAAIELERAVRVNGGRPDYFWINPIKMASLRKSLLNNVLYENVVLEGTANISFKALVIPTDYGQIRVMADPNIDVNLGYMLQSDTWKLYSLGAIANIVDEDGLTYLRQNDEDGVEFRVRSFYELGCVGVGKNGVVQL